MCYVSSGTISEEAETPTHNDIESLAQRPCVSATQGSLSPPNDISNYLSTHLSDDQKLFVLTKHFKPNKLYKYPTRVEYGKNRSFNPAWFDLYPKWLAYSPAEDGAFCVPCVVFGRDSKLSHLVRTPLTFWTTASERFKDHSTKSAIHRDATLKAENFLSVMESRQQSIGEKINKAIATQIEENRRNPL